VTFLISITELGRLNWKDDVRPLCTNLNSLGSSIFGSDPVLLGQWLPTFRMTVVPSTSGSSCPRRTAKLFF